MKYAVDHNLITKEEYHEHHKCILNQFRPAYRIYKQYTLMDFGKSLKTHSTSELKINQSLKSNKFLEKEKCEGPNIISYENINQQNKIINNNFNEYYLDKNLESESENEISKKSRKKRKKKKKLNNYTYENNIETEIIKNAECHNEIHNFTNKVIMPKKSVKIFVRKNNKKYITGIISKNSLVSTKKSIRSIFSQLLKKFKEERRLQCN